MELASPDAPLLLAPLPKGWWRWVPGTATGCVPVGTRGRLLGRHGQMATRGSRCGLAPPAPPDKSSGEGRAVTGDGAEACRKGGDVQRTHPRRGPRPRALPAPPWAAYCTRPPPLGVCGRGAGWGWAHGGHLPLCPSTAVDPHLRPGLCFTCRRHTWSVKLLELPLPPVHLSQLPSPSAPAPHESTTARWVLRSTLLTFP